MDQIWKFLKDHEETIVVSGVVAGITLILSARAQQVMSGDLYTSTTDDVKSFLVHQRNGKNTLLRLNQEK